MTTNAMTIDEQIAYIRDRLAERDEEMDPCLTEEEIADFEQRHGVRLPEGYRRFILEIGNGGYGPPDSGLASLEDSPNLAKPYPFTNAWIWEDESNPDKSMLEYTKYGVLYLGTEGCGENWVLVVTGDERGQIWNNDSLGIAPLAPRRDFLRWYIYWLDGGSDWWAELDG